MIFDHFRFARMLFRAFLPSVLDNGVAFECHPQNCLARFDMITKELRGFIIRDFGGLRIHRETLKATTGVELECLAGHSIIADDLDGVYTRMYHTVFHNHLQQLIRVLGLHYNGRGWAIVRELLEELIPKNHGLYAAWLSPERKTLPGKCFLRMRMSGMYRFVKHSITSTHSITDTALTAYARSLLKPHSLPWCGNRSVLHVELISVDVMKGYDYKDVFHFLEQNCLSYASFVSLGAPIVIDHYVNLNSQICMNVAMIPRKFYKALVVRLHQEIHEYGVYIRVFQTWPT